jgi:hypothetical protein
MHQEYFAEYGEYAYRHKIELIPANFHLKPKKFLIQNQLTKHDRMANKPSHATVPLNTQSQYVSKVREDNHTLNDFKN